MSTIPLDPSLSATLFGKTRRAVLSLLYSHADDAFYLRQIVRAAGVGLGAAQRELKQLAEAGIIRRTAHGRQVYYQANTESPVFEELKNLIARSYDSGGVAEATQQYTAGTPSAGGAHRRMVIPKRKLAAFCQRHYIRKLALFGSVLRKDFRPDSDIDFLVELEPGRSLFDLGGLLYDLRSLLGVEVDVVTEKGLRARIREHVLREAIPL